MKVMDALRFAAERHAGQQYGGVDGLKSYPYIQHCASVVIILQQFGVEDEEVLVAGALHDVLEDTDTTSWEIEKEFGPRVAKIVELVSNPFQEMVYETQDGKRHTVWLFEREGCKIPEDFVHFISIKMLTRKEKHAIQYPKIATDNGAVLVKLADRIANVETGGKIEMYRKEYPFFRETLQATWKKRQGIQDLSGAEEDMWLWLTLKMNVALDKSEASH